MRPDWPERRSPNSTANAPFAPVWVNEQGPGALGEDLVETLGTVVLHGLQPEDSHSGCITTAVDDLAEAVWWTFLVAAGDGRAGADHQ